MSGSCIYAQVIPDGTPMLERKLAYPDSIVHIPYSNLCFINNAELPSSYGWIMDYDIKKSNERSLLVIEMNSSEVFGYAYSSGSVQFIIDVPKFEESYTFDVGSNKIRVRLINNYGSLGSTDDPLIGSLTLVKIKDKIKVSGKVTITTSKPYTKQVVEFNDNLIPAYNLDEFLDKAKERELKSEVVQKQMVEILTKSMMEDTTSIVEKQVDNTNQVMEKITPGQGFELTYSIYGLGSNRDEPSRIIVNIKDSILTYGIMEISNEVSYISYSTGDTIWKKKRVWYDVPFRNHSKNSILSLIADKKGQYFFQTNPYIMSGVIVQIYIEYAGWCVSFSLKNVYNKMGNQIIKILNPYLPNNYQLYETKNDVWTKGQLEPIVEQCTGRIRKSYIDVLGEEYNSIKK